MLRALNQLDHLLISIALKIPLVCIEAPVHIIVQYQMLTCVG